MITSRDDSQ